MAINKVLAPITTSKIHSTKEIGSKMKNKVEELSKALRELLQVTGKMTKNMVQEE